MRLATTATCALLVACSGGTQLPFDSSGRTATTLRQSPRSGSWMLPSARRGALLYAAANTEVEVYTYPGGKAVGQLGPFSYIGGTCADASGNVWITTAGSSDRKTQVVEYAHGATKPLVVINGLGNNAVGCSVDQRSGDLAVANAGYGRSAANVLIYPHAPKYPAISYKLTKNGHYLYCAYDDRGNLFVDGLQGQQTFIFFEKAKGSNSFSTVTLNQGFGYPGAVQWDGAHVAIGDGRSMNVYQFDVSDGNGSEVGTTTLGAAAYLGEQFTIHGGTLIYSTLYRSEAYGFAYWSYPTGGNPTQTFSVGQYHAFTVSR